jgi:hypothetical protein
MVSQRGAFMMPRSTGLLVVFLILFVAPSAWTADDHLKCFRVRDGLKRQPYTADLSGLVPQPGCTISVPALYVCLPSDKTNVHPTPPQEGGGDPTGGFACYRVRCPKAELPPIVIEDQFGTRPATPNVTRMICAPLGPSSVVTNTTTTVQVTTTTAAATTSTTTTTTITTTTITTTTSTSTTSTTLLSLACPYTGPPVFNPASYPECSPACNGAHCVPASILPEWEQSTVFATCTGGFCVPDPLIATAGNYIPPSCDPFSGTGAPGRCLSGCLAFVAAQPLLEQSTCGAGNRCAPCFDPLTGASTEACITSCDAPPATPFTFSGCCGGLGICLPISQLAVGSLPAYVGQRDCPGGPASYQCVAKDQTVELGPPTSCFVDLLFTSWTSICVSDCVLGDTAQFIPRGTCPAGSSCPSP